MNIKLSGTASQIMLMAIIVSIVVLMAGIGVLVIVHACITGRAYPRALNAIIRERCSNGIKKLSPDDLEKLPSFEYKASNKGSNPMDCVVCLDSFQMGDRCRLLPACKHSFHAHCVDSWLLKSPVCPICRASVVVEEQRSYYKTGIGVGVGERHSIVVGLPANAALPDFGASGSA